MARRRSLCLEEQHHDGRNWVRKILVDIAILVCIVGIRLTKYFSEKSCLGLTVVDTSTNYHTSSSYLASCWFWVGEKVKPAHDVVYCYRWGAVSRMDSGSLDETGAEHRNYYYYGRSSYRRSRKYSSQHAMPRT